MTSAQRVPAHCETKFGGLNKPSYVRFGIGKLRTESVRTPQVLYSDNSPPVSQYVYTVQFTLLPIDSELQTFDD